MTCEFVFLPVGNADSIIIYPDGCSAVVIDLHKIPLLLKWFQNKKETNISRIYSDDLQKLLETINAEIAVLSVGSTNRYGHVVPELFNLLINLQNDDSKQLKQFVCTEVTRTCVHSASDISKMSKSGLAKQQLCAGEITIFAETSGKWQLKTETDHENVISTLKYPACKGFIDQYLVHFL